MSGTIATTSTAAALKNFSYIAVFFGSLEAIKYLGFEPKILLLLATVMLIDVITGIYRVYKNEGGEAIESHPLLKGVTAKLMLLLIVLGIGATATITGFNAAPYVQASITVIALGDLYSAMGNLHSARTGKKKVEFDALAFLLVRLRDILDKYVK
jgi:hypothetical protein